VPVAVVEVRVVETTVLCIEVGVTVVPVWTVAVLVVLTVEATDDAGGKTGIVSVSLGTGGASGVPVLPGGAGGAVVSVAGMAGGGAGVSVLPDGGVVPVMSVAGVTGVLVSTGGVE